MAPDHIQELVNEDQRLTIGSEVTAYWNAGGFGYHARARIKSLGPRTVKIVLLENTGMGGKFPAGRVIEVPRIADPTRWSSYNCVRMTARHKQVA